MFGSSKPDNSSIPDNSSTAQKDKAGRKSPSPDKDTAGADKEPRTSSPTPVKTTEQVASGEKRSGNGSPPSANRLDEQKKRRSSGTPLQKLGKQDQTLAVPQGQHNNAAGESLPGPRSTFRVGVWEDRNKRCRRTMEDTHAFLYNFLYTPAPALGTETSIQKQQVKASSDDVPEKEAGGGTQNQDVMQTDNGYFAIFDGHAGTFAADWCGKKLHIILEDMIRKHPNSPIPELLDQTFTSVDSQLEKLPIKNSGCTAAVAVLRWEDRVPSSVSATGSQAIAPAVAKAAAVEEGKQSPGTATRQRVLYTANVGDARIILCRQGKALRLSYDHKGSDENEGKRISNAGGLILNNRVNGVLAVTRALGDTYMKDLVTGHPYTTETVIQPDLDEFIIIACDGLWDVCSDQDAVDLVRNIQDPNAAAKLLVDHALARFSTDNLSCMIVRFDKQGLLDHQTNKGENAIGVEGDPPSSGEGKISEVEKIVNETKAKIADGNASAVGVSASNSGRGHDLVAPAGPVEEDFGTAFKPTAIEGSVAEEEPEHTVTTATAKEKAEAVVDRVEGKGEEKKSDGGDDNPPPPYNTNSSS